MRDTLESKAPNAYHGQAYFSPWHITIDRENPMRGYNSYEVFSVLYKFKAGEVYNAGEFEFTSKQIYSLNSVGGGRVIF